MTTAPVNGYSNTSNLIVAVGSENPVKISAVQRVVLRLFKGDVKVHGYSVASGVSNQPMSDEETIEGAIARAKRALDTGADFGVGIEGGVAKIGDRWYESGWVAVVDRKGEIGLGSSARLEMSSGIMTALIGGKELGDVMDELTGLDDVKKKMGAFGILTNGNVDRCCAYEHGVHFAFAKFTTEQKYWV